MNEQTKKNLLAAVRNFWGYLSDEYVAIDALLDDGGKGEAVALWAAFAPEGNLLAYSKLRPGLSDILNWEPLYRTAPQAECAPREAQPVAWRIGALYYDSLEAAKEWVRISDESYPIEPLYAAPTPERAQESAGVRLTPEQSGAIQIAISILTPEYLLTANRLRSIVATIDAELAKKEGA